MTDNGQERLFGATDAPVANAGSPLTYGEFFAGIGLVRAGLERMGWRIVFANDLDAQKREMYEDNFGPSPHYVLEDIHRLVDQPEQLPEMILAHASFPCTDLSVAGARRGLNAGQSSAFWGFERLLEQLGDRRPPVVLLENVLGFLTSGGGQDFKSAMKAMNRLGYVVDPLKIDAAHFVPQSRPRLFIVAYQPWLARGLELIDATRVVPSTVRPESLLRVVREFDDIDWSFACLPELPPIGQRKLQDVLDNPAADSPEWWSDERANYLLEQMSERHRAIADGWMQRRRWSSGTVFRRVRKKRSMAELRTDGIAGCLRTPKGGSGRQILFQAGYGRHRVRLLNAAECARLMGVDGFTVKVRLNQALYGFGDAVCADAVEWVAKHYLNALGDAAVKKFSLMSAAS